MFISRQVIRLSGMVVLAALMAVGVLTVGGVVGRSVTVEAVKLVEYQEKGGLSFKYPDGWKVTDRIQNGARLLHMVDFLAPDKSVYGIIQIWQQEKTLDSFIEDAKSGKAENINIQEIKKARIHGREGYLIDYTLLPKIANAKVKPVSIRDFIFEEKGLFYRLMYSLPNSSWDEENQDLFGEIIKSIKIIN